MKRGRSVGRRRGWPLVLAPSLIGLFIAAGRCEAQAVTLAHPEYLITAHQLQAELRSPGLLILDVRPPGDYGSGHIPGAVNFPLAELQHTVRLANGNLSPAIVKPAAEIEGPLRQAGINEDSRIVVYDGGETYDATRVWWMLDYYGLPHIALLDGGLPAWEAEGGGLSTQPVHPKPGNARPVPDPQKIATYSYVESHLGTKATALCDALSASSYQSGAIPGSLNLPWTETIDTNAFGKLKGANQLASLLASLHLGKNHEIIFYCERGYLSSVEYFAARALGYTHVRLYDGSLSDFIAHGGTLLPAGGR